MVKAEIRLPTVQFGYINFFVEYEDDGMAEKNIIAQHNRIVKTYQNSLVEAETPSGLNSKDWQRVLDTYLVNNSIQSEDLDAMSDKQKGLINEVKKSINRIKARNE